MNSYPSYRRRKRVGRAWLSVCSWVCIRRESRVDIYVFSVPGLGLIGTTPVGQAPDWLTFTADGSRCYDSNAGSDAVSVVDVLAGKEVTRIPVGAVPKRLISVDRP